MNRLSLTDNSLIDKKIKTKKIKKIFRNIMSYISCFFGKHEWKYMWANFHAGKDVFNYINC
jgi:hypothetical protein